MSDIIKENLITVKELSEQLKVSKDTVLNCIKKIFPDKMKHGKTTFLNEKEITLIIDYLKNNQKVMEQITVEAGSTVQNTTTSLTPALKIKQAMEMMQEAYEEELEILRLKNEEQQKTIDNYKLATEKKIDKQKLFSEINRLIRKKAYDDFDGVFEDSYRYYYKELANRHNFIHKVDMTFLKHHKEYAQELLEMLL